MKILLVEDEKDLSKALCVLLKKNNYTVDAVYNGQDAIYFLDDIKYDLVILDIMLPIKNGIEVLKDMRSKGNQTPVLILSAKAEVEDKIYGLDSGADDYLPKPFNINELLARIRALTRRLDTINNIESILFGNVKLDRSKSTISTEYGVEYLLNKEYQILELLILNKDCIVSLDTIISNVWATEDYSTVNNLWVFISYLRKKLINVKANFTVKSHRNIGYSLEYIDEKN